MAAVRAGAAYFALVFALGLLLGALRHWAMGTGLAPSREALVALEVPVMLAFAWWAAGWCARRFGVPTALEARLLMGGVMFVLLRLGEIGVGTLLMGQSAASILAALATPAGVAELAPQVLTAFFPLFLARFSRS